ncbi:MAG: rhodanese-like domain-containing protein [Acidobacteriota bacterium]
MSEARRTLRQAAVLVGLSVAVAAAVHIPLIGRFARGEFRESFFPAAEYPGIRMVTLAEAEELWRTGQAVILDARAAGFFERGHVPGARNLPAAGAKGALPAGILEIPRDRTCLVYCEGGDCRSSLSLARRLHDAGFRDIRVFGGGWEEWTGAGLPEEKSGGQE